MKYDSAGMDENLNQYEYVFPRTVDGKPPFAAAGTVMIDGDAPVIYDKKTGKAVAKQIRSTDPLLLVAVGAPLIVDKKTGRVEEEDFRSTGGGSADKPGKGFSSRGAGFRDARRGSVEHYVD